MTRIFNLLNLAVTKLPIGSKIQMTLSENTSSSTANPKLVWAGRVITLLIALAFGMSAMMKVKGGPEFGEQAAKLGLPDSMRLPLAVLEVTCLVVYLIPQTAVIGAILLTGYIGGAICTHLRIGDTFVVPHIVIGILFWLGIYLREPRLWALLPFRRTP